MSFIMANLKNIIVSLMVILTATFLFMGQTAAAGKGPKITHKVYFDIEQNGESLGRVVMGLYGKTVPRVCSDSPFLSRILTHGSCRPPRTSVPWQQVRRASATRARDSIASSNNS